MWDMDTCECIRTYFRNEGIPGHRDEVRSCAIYTDLLLDERRIVSTGLDQTVKVWNAATGMVIHSMKGHT